MSSSARSVLRSWPLLPARRSGPSSSRTVPFRQRCRLPPPFLVDGYPMHLCTAGGSQQQPPRCCLPPAVSTGRPSRRWGHRPPPERTTRDAAPRPHQTVHENLGDRHAGPACRIGESAGMPRASGPNVAQLGREQVRCGQHVIHLLGREGGPAIAQHRQAPVGMASDLTGVKQHHPCSRNIGGRAMLSAVGCVQSHQSTRCLTPRAVRHGAIERAILQAVPTDSEGPGHERRPARQPHR